MSSDRYPRLEPPTQQLGPEQWAWTLIGSQPGLQPLGYFPLQVSRSQKFGSSFVSMNAHVDWSATMRGIHKLCRVTAVPLLNYVPRSTGAQEHNRTVMIDSVLCHGTDSNRVGTSSNCSRCSPPRTPRVPHQHDKAAAAAAAYITKY